ncbi:hypothetical protein FKW77_005664 [Venturia effusa]|uniref:C2H2-type domain-containing protein n=1 Tax=Venturia effusa TaxID=50376 RepID=A0A517LQ82_9PEZI|nr:hypothetical protein FKW77_005664 [Venturia effusa]
MAHSELGTLRCLCISQEDGAKKDLNKLAQIKVKPEKTKADIRAFCAASHQKIKQKFGCLLTEEHDVTNLVAARSEGMFLYARLVAEILEQQDTFHYLKSELEPSRLPHGIEEAYERTIQRMLDPNINSDSRRKNVLKLLGWLSYTKNGIYNPHLKFVEMQDCKDICGSLVESTIDASIVLVHSTTKHYLFEKAIICEARVELNLAVMCLTYLSTPEFDLDDPMIENNILEGFYAFADYAVPFWGLHVEHAISQGDRKLPNKYRKYGELVECLEAFILIQWMSSKIEAAIPRTLRQTLMALHKEDFIDDLCRAIHDLKARLRPATKEPPNAQVLRIYENYAKVRSVLESLVSSATCSKTTESILIKNYTNSWFKCSRLNCQYYHRGFPTRAQRDQHKDKHERSFTCAMEGCHQSIIGCTTLKELEKHVFEIHGYHITRPEAEYPADVPLTKQRPQKESSKHTCPQCRKSFTRNHALRVHQRSHDDTRPFECATCGKTFAREYDCRRHEKLHTGEKKYICLGTLDGGESWGCKQSFARSEALASHFRSKGGRKCIKALLEQQNLDGSAAHEQVSLLVEVLPGLLEPAEDDVVALVAREAALKENDAAARPALSLASTPAPQELSPSQPDEMFDEDSENGEEVGYGHTNSRPRLADQLFDDWRDSQQ